jgi:hypothetical protein
MKILANEDGKQFVMRHQALVSQGKLLPITDPAAVKDYRESTV